MTVYKQNEYPCTVEAGLLEQLPFYQQKYLDEYDFFLFMKEINGEPMICLSSFDMDEAQFETIDELTVWVEYGVQ